MIDEAEMSVVDGRLVCGSCGPVLEPDCFVECCCQCHDLEGAHGDCFCDDCMPVVPELER